MNVYQITGCNNENILSMKKLLCILLFLFPVVAYSQNQSEWERQSAEQQIREYYQSKLNAKNDELRKAQNELNGLLNLSDSEFTEEVKSQGAYLGAKIEVLKAEKKALENKLRELQTQTQTTAKSVQSQKSRQQKNAARQKQNQSRMAETSKTTEEEAQRKRAEDTARKAREEQEEQERQVQFKTDKQKNMRDNSQYFDAQRANAGYKASPQAYGQMCAGADCQQVQRTIDNVAPVVSGRQVKSSKGADKLRRRNGGEQVYVPNQMDATISLDAKLKARDVATKGGYNEGWSLEQKEEALAIWLGSDAEMRNLSKEDIHKKYENALSTVSQDAQRDAALFRMAQTQPEKEKALQRQYAEVVPDRRNTETHFWSQIEDPGKQSEIIDVLVRQCRDSQGYVNSNAIRQVVEAVDLGVELMNRGQILGGDRAVTQRANEVLAVFSAMCENGFCKK